ncbi:3-ketoacyl-CoA thiolase, mitochondrial [Galendromus occidentalis]|uniref:3-ketoacyl-CoA thiolase, mitochondrial n=1 Tax=Galendromus occidentalis TaxID=34638 RepID=A0AAJ6QQV2_9ACAR|nr:3-ketoacyl-CoA thiolase, mitochondrial [Galendromus occidentalis]
MSLVRGVFIVGAKRTPFGAMGGKLKDWTPTDLSVAASKAAIAQAGVDPKNIDTCVAGIINQIAAKDSAYCSRHTALKVGMLEHTPALNINRMCGSGFQACVNVAQEIMLGNAQIGLAVGTENMSMSPFVLRGARFGIRFGTEPPLECSLSATLTDQYCKLPMALTAEKLAEKYSVSRKDVDQFALTSQQRWAQAQANHRFKDEMVPLDVKVKGKMESMDIDEHPKPKTTIEILEKLPSLFKKDGTVTAGNASGICDGAGAILLASEEAVKKHGLKPLARLVGYSYVGVDPSIMGIGPAPAIRALCDKTGIKQQNVDLFEINEAFASQFLAVQKDLALDLGNVNVNGGAIALGHPVGASGARIIANLVYELKARQKKTAIGSACIGGGQGIAVMIENC